MCPSTWRIQPAARSLASPPVGAAGESRDPRRHPPHRAAPARNLDNTAEPPAAGAAVAPAAAATTAEPDTARTVEASAQERQPGVLHVLAWSEPHRNAFWHRQAEHVFPVVRDARCIAMCPLRENLEIVVHVPVGDASVAIGIDACLLGQLAARRGDERLAGLLAPGDGLPVLREVGTLEQKHLEARRMNEHEYRYRNLVTHAWPDRGRSGWPPSKASGARP